jgi:hypothetical protein
MEVKMFKQFKVIFGLIIVLQSTNLLAQEIVSENWYGGNYRDEGYDAVQMDDGGFLITGIYQESYYNDIYLIRTNSNGDTLWTKTYGGGSWDNGRSIISTYDNMYLVAGRTFSSGSTSSGDGYLIKIDADGNFVWDETYGSSDKDGSFNVIQTSDSCYVFTGQYDYSDLWVLKTDSAGVEIWSKTYGVEIGYKLIETSDKNYLVTGASGSPNNMYIAKLNSSNGDTIWTCSLGGNNREWGYALCNSYNGGYIALGSTNSFGAGGYDIYLAEITADGDTIATKTFGMAQNENCYSICQTPDSGYIICGSTNSIGTGLNDIYVIKLDINLDTLWTETYGGIYNDWANQILCSADGNYVIIGSTESFGNSGDVYFLKISENDPSNIDFDSDNSIDLPDRYSLTQNHPNPFNPTTTISYSVAQSGHVKLTIYNVLGQEMTTLVDGHLTSGKYKAQLNAQSWRSGIYFYQLKAGGQSFVKRMLLIK